MWHTTNGYKLLCQPQTPHLMLVISAKTVKVIYPANFVCLSAWWQLHIKLLIGSSENFTTYKKEMILKVIWLWIRIAEFYLLFSMATKNVIHYFYLFCFNLPSLVSTVNLWWEQTTIWTCSGFASSGGTSNWDRSAIIRCASDHCLL